MHITDGFINGDRFNTWINSNVRLRLEDIVLIADLAQSSSSVI